MAKSRVLIKPEAFQQEWLRKIGREAALQVGRLGEADKALTEFAYAFQTILDEVGKWLLPAMKPINPKSRIPTRLHRRIEKQLRRSLRKSQLGFSQLQEALVQMSRAVDNFKSHRTKLVNQASVARQKRKVARKMRKYRKKK